MIKATVLTWNNHKIELHFEDRFQYRKWKVNWIADPLSERLVYGWERSVRQCDITRVISVEEEN